MLVLMLLEMLEKVVVIVDEEEDERPAKETCVEKAPALQVLPKIRN
jgi:hypothetical protein